MKNRLLIFTKNPILGTAKTRIGKVKGDEIALKVYKTLLRYTRDIVSGLELQKIVFFNKFLEGPEGIWSMDEFVQKLQARGNLGIKMATAFQDEFSEGAEKVIIIGSDCAELQKSDILEAIKKLDQSDVVIGPAVDGGYYLLGMNKYYPEIFEDKPWSQENLLEVTLGTLNKSKISYEVLEEKSDIDFWEDWDKLDWELD